MARGVGSAPAWARRNLSTIVAVAVAITVLAACGLTWWLLAHNETSEPVAQPEQPLTEPRAQEIAEQLTSRDEAQIRKAFVVPPEQALDLGLAESLAGIELEIDATTYEPTSSETATVEAEVTDASGTTTDWTLALMLTDAGWMVLHTMPTDEVPE